MTLKNTWVAGDQFTAADMNAVASAVNTLSAGGGASSVTSTSITDATTVGRALLTASSAAAARTAVGAQAKRLKVVHVDDYGADPTGVADSTAALNAAYDALGGDFYDVSKPDAQNGVIQFGVGVYKISQGLNNDTGRCLTVGQAVCGQGSANTKIKYTGPGAFLEFRNKSYEMRGANNHNQQAGGCFGLYIEGANNSNANICGIRYGDIYHMRIIDVQVHFFQTSGSKGIWADNQIRYAERTYMDVTLAKCTECVTFESNTGDRNQATGSFDYSTYKISTVVSPNQDSVVIRTGQLQPNESKIATTAATGTGTTATLSMTVDPNVQAGDLIHVQGVTPAAYNGYHKVTAIGKPNSAQPSLPFTVSFDSAATGNQTVAGTVTAWFEPNSAPSRSRAVSGTGTTATIRLDRKDQPFGVGDRITVRGVTPTAYNVTNAPITAIGTATEGTGTAAITYPTVSYACTATGSQTVAGLVSATARIGTIAASGSNGTATLMLDDKLVAQPFTVGDTITVLGMTPSGYNADNVKVTAAPAAKVAVGDGTMAYTVSYAVAPTQIGTIAASGTGTTATLMLTDTLLNQPFLVGDTITVTGMTPSGYNATNVQVTAAPTAKIAVGDGTGRMAFTVSYASTATGSQTVAGFVSTSTGSQTVAGFVLGDSPWAKQVGGDGGVEFVGVDMTIWANCVPASSGTTNTGVLFTVGEYDVEQNDFTGSLNVFAETSGTGYGHRDFNVGATKYKVSSKVHATGLINLSGNNLFRAGTATNRSFIYAGSLRRSPSLGSSGNNRTFQPLQALYQARGYYYLSGDPGLQSYTLYAESGNIFYLEPDAGSYKFFLNAGSLSDYSVASQSPFVTDGSPFGATAIDLWIRQPQATVANPNPGNVTANNWFPTDSDYNNMKSFQWADGQTPQLSTTPGDWDLIRLTSFNFADWVGEHITKPAGGSGTDATKEPIITAGTTAQYWRGDKTWQTLNSTAVGLGNVSNIAQQPLITAGTTSQWYRGDKTWQKIGAETVGKNYVVPGNYASGYYYLFNSAASSSTSNGLGNQNLRLSPAVITSTVAISRLWVEHTAAGEATAVFRIGIYADDGTGWPGNLIVDAGTVSMSGAAAVQEVTVDVTLTPGVYWIGGVLQGAATTQPTIRTINGGQMESHNIPCGTTLPTANTLRCSVVKGSVSAALPTSFSSLSTGVISGSYPARVGFKVA